ncbi:MAG: prepilin-type N-terminal cleavage/methylation domain-containing protein, partial [Elusimicrobiaceae bacterium]|nr:prepilin-type N-terminal cleavage/methylation domain-containing protein [Elusimicrobiaceae bacterium]
MSRRGFTLIEVLVVVLIIAVLAAVAVPQYQKAVLKSRFSSLMPTTKAVHNGNEAYYLMHSGYARLLNELDVT